VDTKSKIYLSWDEIERLVNKLAIKTPNEIDSIMGLARGGLIPAIMLSHKLNLPLVFVPYRNTLIVDDICDSGKTFLEIRKSHPYNKLTCLHYKPHTSRFIPNIYAEEFTSDDWIVYPWERNDSNAIQDYLK
jgi:hypoxanthine phosphoribosyltransferase